MLIKAVISSVDIATQSAELILPEYDGAVTGNIPFYIRPWQEPIKAEDVPGMIGEFVVFGVFGDDWNDGVIL